MPEAVLRYRWWIICTSLAVTTLVTLWTFRLPKVYQATVTLEYDPNPISPLGTSVEDVSGQVSHFLMSREFFETQNRIIQSRAVAERVVEHLGLADDPTFFGQEPGADWTPVSKEVAAQRLQSKLSLDPIKDTRLVLLKVRDNDPERAATLANMVASSYIEKTMEDRLGSTAAAAEWLAQQLDSTRTQLNESEHALHEFKKQHNVLSVSVENRQNLLAEEIREYNERLTDIRARRIELEARLGRLKATRSQPEAVQDTDRGEDSELDALRTELRSKMTERASLAVRYGDSHPKILELKGEIAAIRSSIDYEIKTLIKVAADDLKEAQAVENGLSKVQNKAQKAGMDLNLREIEYSRLNRQRESNAKLYDLLLKRTAETDLTRLLRTTHVRVVDAALVPKGAISPMVSLNVIGGAFGGLLLGFGLAFLLHQMDRRIQDVPDVERLGLTILGVFPRVSASGADSSGGYSSRRKRERVVEVENPDQVVHTHPMSMAAESCRTVRTNLMFMAAESPNKTMVVTSANPKDGKTTVATNISIALAQSGQRVLLIDADLRRPRIHKAFGLENHAGLTNTLVGERTLTQVTRDVGIDKLSVVTCGPLPPNPAELLHTQQFSRLLEEAASQYDRVIFDSPPLRAVTDAAILAPQCGGVLLVVRARATTRDAVLAAIRSLTDVRAHILGGVLNDVEVSRGGQAGVGGAYYHYYRGEEYRTESTPPGPSQSAA
ncbi:MAG: polysaccharide biosynthesis tyrosine autokinase [Myxococcales bacterium]|nr:polysaccharide biosynthesis tyrosine autokinase [Myxococcales bacterium]